MAERKLNLDSEQFPSNSNTKKEQDLKKATKSVEKVVTGQVKQRKKPLMKRIADIFIGDDIDNVKEYLFTDVFVPAMKNTISDMVSQGVEMLLFGERGSRANRIRRDGGKSYVSYSSYYNDKPNKKQHVKPERTLHSLNDIIFETRIEAENVLSSLVDLVIDFGLASVADLYDLCGLETDYTKHHWGWTDLSGASITRVRDGYILDLPKPYSID